MSDDAKHGAGRPVSVTYASPTAAMVGNLRFAGTGVLFLVNIVCLLNGGLWLWAPLILAMTIGTLIDEIIGDDLCEPANPPLRANTFLCYSMLPLAATSLLLYLHFFTVGDPIGLTALLSRLGIDFSAARNATSLADLGAALLGQGLLLAFSLSAVHELSHQTTNPISLLLSRLIGAFSFEPWLLIHHPHGHHNLVGLPEDNATARRGETLYSFFFRAFPGAARFSADYERRSLARTNTSFWSFRNRFLTGILFMAGIAALSALIAGPLGVAVYLLVALSARFLFEGSTYIEHYGLVRAPGEPVSERFTWDVYRNVTNALLFNVGRHADHHAYATRPGGLLRLNDKAPYLPKGYVTLILMAMCPPLFFRFIAPYLANWDRHFATAAELDFMQRNNIPHIEPTA